MLWYLQLQWLTFSTNWRRTFVLRTWWAVHRALFGLILWASQRHWKCPTTKLTVFTATTPALAVLETVDSTNTHLLQLRGAKMAHRPDQNPRLWNPVLRSRATLMSPSSVQPPHNQHHHTPASHTLHRSTPRTPPPHLHPPPATHQSQPWHPCTTVSP